MQDLHQNYLRRWLKTAFTRSPSAIDLWTGAACAVLGVADHYLPQMQLMSSFGWQVPIWILAGVMAVRLIMAPYWMAKTDAKEIARLKAIENGLRNQTAPRRISFVELRAIATEYGWDFADYSDQLLTFTYGIRQAAVDGKITVEGRKGCVRMPESMSGLYPLQPIPKEHLLDWWIDPPRDKNWSVRTYQPGSGSGSDDNCYVDLHLNDETWVRAWLATDAEALKQPQPNIEAEKALVHIAWHSAVGSQRESISAFETAARDGRLQVWGCSCTQEPYVNMGHEKIDRDYWTMASLDVESFILGDGPRSSPSEYEHGTQTKQRTLVPPGLREPSYWHLRVNRDHVLELWPTIRLGSPALVNSGQGSQTKCRAANILALKKLVRAER